MGRGCRQQAPPGHPSRSASVPHAALPVLSVQPAAATQPLGPASAGACSAEDPLCVASPYRPPASVACRSLPPPPPPCLPLCPYRRPRKRAQPGCARPAVLSKLRWVARGRVVGGGPSSSGAQSGALRPAVHTALPCAALRLPRVRAHPLAATGLHSLASRLQARTCTTWHASLPPPHGTPPLARRRCGGALGLGIWGWCSACGTHAAPLLLGAAPPAGRGRGGGVLPRLRRRHAAFMQRTQPAPIHSKPY